MEMSVPDRAHWRQYVEDYSVEEGLHLFYMMSIGKARIREWKIE